MDSDETASEDDVDVPMTSSSSSSASAAVELPPAKLAPHLPRDLSFLTSQQLDTLENAYRAMEAELRRSPPLAVLEDLGVRMGATSKRTVGKWFKARVAVRRVTLSMDGTPRVMQYVLQKHLSQPVRSGRRPSKRKGSKRPATPTTPAEIPLDVPAPTASGSAPKARPKARSSRRRRAPKRLDDEVEDEEENEEDEYVPTRSKRLTSRQKALYEDQSFELLSLPMKAKSDRAPTEEQLLRKSELARKRRLKEEKRTEEAKTTTIRKLLEKGGTKKRRLKQSLQKKPKRTRVVSAPGVKMIESAKIPANPDNKADSAAGGPRTMRLSISVSFPDRWPLVGLHQLPREPPPPQVCANPTCQNSKAFAIKKQPVCSLACFKTLTAK